MNHVLVKKTVIFAKTNLRKNILMMKNILELLKNRGAAHGICNLEYNTPTEVTVAFHNGLNYDE